MLIGKLPTPILLNLLSPSGTCLRNGRGVGTSSTLLLFLAPPSLSLTCFWQMWAAADAQCWFIFSWCALFAGPYRSSTFDSSFVATCNATSVAVYFCCQGFISQLGSDQPSKFSSRTSIFLLKGPHLSIKCALLSHHQQKVCSLPTQPSSFLDSVVSRLLTSCSFNHLPLFILGINQISTPGSFKLQEMQMNIPK